MANFHFQNPWWLASLLPLALLLWTLTTSSSHSNGWKAVIDRKLQPLLLAGNTSAATRSWLWLLAFGWVVTSLALADPAWERKPQPVFQTDAARVIVLDLSSSMQIKDIKPSRLARAKFKIEDILSTKQEGQTGLIVFAGDAFTVTPLTRDDETLRALLASLDTKMMPVQGSRADLGLIQAGDLLKQAGVARGQVLLIADGAEKNPALAAAKTLRKAGHRVSVLGVGTLTGGPLPNLRRQNNKPIIVPLQEKVLQAIAAAGGGVYRRMTGGDQDIRALIADTPGQLNHQSSQSRDLQQQGWVSEGPWLVLLLLPLGALAFRRGWVLSVLLAAVITYQPAPALASPLENLWLRQDQQADKALRQGKYNEAAKVAHDPLRKGSAEYKAGHFDKALKDFSEAKGPTADYNRGNALAQLGKYKEAIKAYDEALKQQPALEDAATNKKRIEDLLKKQQQKKESGQKKNQQKQSEKQKKEGQKKSDQKQSQKNNQQQSTKNQSGQQGQQQNKQEQKGKSGKKKDKQNPSSQQNSGKKASSGDEKKNKKPSSTNKAHENQQQKSGNKKAEEKNQFAKAAEDLKKKAGENPEGKKEKRKSSGADKPREKPEKNQQKKEKQPGQQAKMGQKGKPGNTTRPPADSQAKDLSDEEKLAAKQWLRRIPDDPGGLLRRKFEYQYKQRARPQNTVPGNPW